MHVYVCVHAFVIKFVSMIMLQTAREMLPHFKSGTNGDGLNLLDLDFEVKRSKGSISQ